MVLSFAKLALCSNAAVAQQQQHLSLPISSPSLVLHCTACGDSDAARRHITRLSTEDVPLRSFQNWKMLAWIMPHHRGIASRAGGCVNLRNWQLRCMDPSQEEERAEASREGIVQQPRSERVQQQGVDGFQRAKLAVFLSGGGSNFRALHAATLQNAIYGDVVLVVSDRPGCKGCEYAQEHKIPILPYPKNKYAQDGISASQLVDSLRHSGVDYILLAGYLKMLPTELVQVFPRAILNIHPALLPSFGGKGFYGMKVHEAVIRSGARYSGATVHFVDEEYDSGPILAQRVVPVLAYDSPSDLAARVLKQEHILYTEAVAALCEDRIFWREDGVPLIRKSWDEAEYL
ncbi:hypothetical protein CY35_08G122900 [Sphagnum magellanicum]|nr:hypothetical protein CY35_08G122900 [Sphagnum magellanicum]